MGDFDHFDTARQDACELDNEGNENIDMVILTQFKYRSYACPIR